MAEIFNMFLIKIHCLFNPLLALCWGPRRRTKYGTRLGENLISCLYYQGSGLYLLCVIFGS